METWPGEVFKSFVMGDVQPGMIYEASIRTNGQVEVVNRSMKGTIWCRFDGEDPQPDSHDSFVVIATRRFNTNRGTVKVRWCVTQALDISIEGSIFGPSV